jgi:hypothetical protein
MLVCVFLSFVVDWRTWNQVKLGFINRRLVLCSLLLDLLIFGGGIWEIVALINLNANTETRVVGALLILVTFLRVSNILSMVFYILFCLPLHCCPESSLCYKWLDSDELNIEVCDFLKANEWVYNDKAMINKKRPKCLMCISDLNHGDSIWFLPCPPAKRYRS